MTGGFNFLDLPTYINQAVLGGSPGTLWIAKMAICGVIIFVILITILILNKKSSDTGPVMIQIMLVEFVAIGIMTGLGWMSPEILISLIMILAFGLAIKTRPLWLGGDRGGN